MRVTASRAQQCGWAFVLICLALPLETQQFSFGFGSDEADEQQKAPAGGKPAKAAAAAGDRKLAPRRAAEQKFKFHKIERVYVDELNSLNEEDIDMGGGEQHDDESKQLSPNDADDNDHDNDEDADEDDDDDDDDDDDAEEEAVQQARRSLAAAKAAKQQRKKQQKNAKQRKGKQLDSEAAEDDNEDQSMLDWLLDAVFGGETQASQPAATKQSSNNIINWLQWLMERLSEGESKLSGKAAKPPKQPKQESSWLSYLKRWPFNSIFPMMQREASQSPSGGGKQHEPQQSTRAPAVEQSPPMSQQHFELLMHTLPAFVVNASRVEHGDCRQQLQVLHRQLRAHKLWALQMLDATGKLGSGLLRGNINQLGDFDMCTQLRAAVKVTPDQPVRIRGKYCLAQIELRTRHVTLKMPLHLANGRGLWHAHLDNPRHFMPRYTVANWGVCVPHACAADVVQNMLVLNLQPYNDTGIEFHVEVDEEDCVVRPKTKFLKQLKKNKMLGLSVLTIAALALSCLLALLWQHWSWAAEQLQRLRQRVSISKEPPPAEASDAVDAVDAVDAADSTEPVAALEQEQLAWRLLSTLLGAFSPQRSWQRLIALEGSDLQFPLLHVLKVLASLLLYVCLKFLMLGHLPLSNRERLVETVDQRWTMLFRAPLLYADVLLLISGFLAACQLCQQLQQHGHINLLRSVANKATRYLPTLYVVLCFQTWILPQLQAAPLWNPLVGEHARICGQQMWRHVLSLQNAVDFEQACSPMTLQLALDVQLYLLAPLLVWLFHTDSEAGFFVYGALHAVSVAARYARTQREQLAPTIFHGINLSKFYRTANLLYASPISRASSHLLGVGAGLLYHSEGAAALPVAPHLLRYGWALCALCLGWCYLAPASSMHSSYVYEASEAAAYMAWSPLLLGLAICWCIFKCPWQASDMLRLPRLSRTLLLLSRIAYPLQLASFVVVLWNTASVKESLQFQRSDLLDVPELLCIVALGLLLALLIDVPAQQLRQLCMAWLFTERAPAAEPAPAATEEDAAAQPSAEPAAAEQHDEQQQAEDEPEAEEDEEEE